MVDGGNVLFGPWGIPRWEVKRATQHRQDTLSGGNERIFIKGPDFPINLWEKFAGVACSSVHVLFWFTP